jgi:hypothetical protein
MQAHRKPQRQKIGFLNPDEARRFLEARQGGT